MEKRASNSRKKATMQCLWYSWLIKGHCRVWILSRGGPAKFAVKTLLKLKDKSCCVRTVVCLLLFCPFGSLAVTLRLYYASPVGRALLGSGNSIRHFSFLLSMQQSLPSLLLVGPPPGPFSWASRCPRRQPCLFCCSLTAIQIQE